MKNQKGTITIVGEAEKDKNNGARRVRYKCSCGYEGTTRLSRALKLTSCKECTHKYSKIKKNKYSIKNGVAYIDVSTSKFPDAVCEIDAEDLHKVIDGKGRWFAANFNKGLTVYAVRNSKGIKMHRVIMQAADGVVIDHSDGNGLNNRKENLSLVDMQINAKNRGLDRRNRTGVIGVVHGPKQGKWIAQGSSNNKRYHLGTFDCFDAAVAARKQFERKHGFNKNHGRAEQ